MGTDTPQDLVPVTVIAGYLGAGKTTLINELLAHDHGRRLAVLVNDFGAVNIDATLIADHNGQTISLKNGCVCCSIADELGDALDRVLALEPAPDQIVIEASGVADPANVAAYGQGWPGCRLDAVVVLADTETVQAKSRDQFVGELVVRQLRRADIVMATKCDLVTEAGLAAVMDWLAATAPGAPVLTRRAGQLEPELLLETAQSIYRPSRQQPHADNGPDEPAFDSAVIEVDNTLDRDRVEAALQDWPDSVLRVKGILRFNGAAGGLHIVQRVGRRWNIAPAPNGFDPSHTGKLVVIGLPGTLHRRYLASSLLN
ncbi:MAG: GTP-binding protein [Acidimicrobiaceae bacterium]|nr:GTP-binding protein [Acidimicrobiaceae bacterium]MDE0516053.1 GTP-binding protein [Acidimicrobiaceae bacterium]MDE0657714.1 GTP-binding protein [Acidimicrobiaceae bacterium]MXZ95838.1 GTP-binding protein [Acidimicrobiaceae bacterium]MYF42001.1 GTP-binding protein [Acidimicrobiaceae bacterium]